MAEPLTATERKVYQYLLDFLAENTYQPSIREIGKRFRIKSTKTVSDVLQSLADKGYIERDPSRSRGVRLLGVSSYGGTQPVPYYGRVAAGSGTPSPQHREFFITLDRRFLPTEDVFFLRVEGNSMNGRAIAHGDYVLVNPSARAHDGDIVAARIGDQSMVKTISRRGALIVLESASPDERDIMVGPQDDFAILGVVCGVFRPLADSGASFSLARAPEETAEAH